MAIIIRCHVVLNGCGLRLAANASAAKTDGLLQHQQLNGMLGAGPLRADFIITISVCKVQSQSSGLAVLIGAVLI